MAKKQLNKNLVGGLTAAVVVTTVIVVAVATLNAAQRDPELIAAKARAALESNNPKRAMELYGRAFRVNQEVKYLVEASRIAYQLGDVGTSIGQLVGANSQDPENVAVLEELLNRYWELHRAGVDQRLQLRDYSDKLLAIDPKNLLGLVSRGEALERLRDQDPKNADLAREALDAAIAIDIDNPAVALLRTQREINDATEAARKPNASADIAPQMRARITEILRSSLAKHPGEPDLVIRLAATLWDSNDLAAARETVESALKLKPDNPDLLLYQARILNTTAARMTRDGAESSETLPLLQASREYVEKAIKVEPGLYEAYGVRAVVLQQIWRAEGRMDRELSACHNEILQIFSDALRDTVGLKSIKAVLGRVALVRLIIQAFDTALSFHGEAPDAEHKAAMVAQARKFYEEARTRFTESVVVPLMQGQLAMLDRDARGAIQSFLAAEERAGELSPMFARMAQENLALLYRESNEFGNSLKYAERAIQSYVQDGERPSLRMLVLRGQLLTLLERPQEALDSADVALRAYPDERELRRVRATALAMLGRTDDAQAAIGEDAGDTDAVLTRARFAAHSGELEAAEQALRALLEKEPHNTAVIQLLMQVLTRANKNDAALELIDQVSALNPSEETQRVLQAFRIVLTAKDPAERDAKLLEVIEQIPDEATRLTELYNFHVTRGDPKSAAQHLDALEKLTPDDPQILRLQFETSLAGLDFAKAEKYLPILTRRNADNAGGAVLRGMLKGAQGDPIAAVQEFRAAEQLLPTDSQLKLRIAQALLQHSPPQVEQAVESLQQALEADPRSFIGNKLMYVCLESLDRQQEAVAFLQVAARINPNDPFIIERKRILDEQVDPATGIAWREPLRQQEPENIENLLRLGDLYIRSGQDPKAEEVLKAALAVAPGDRRVAQSLAVYYAARNRLEDGEKVVLEHVGKTRGFALIRAYELLGRFYESTNNFEKALAALTEGVRKTDEDVFSDEEERRAGKVHALAELAEYYDRRKQIPERLEALRAALALLKPEEVGPRQSADLKIMKTLLQARQFGEAERAIEEFTRLYPADPRGIMAQAELLTTYNVTQERLEQAREIVSRILRDVPDHRWCLFTRGKVNLSLRRFDEARADLVKLKQLMPTGYNLEHRFALARLYELREQYELAEQELRELVALADPPNQGIALQFMTFLKRTKQIAKALEFVNLLVTRYPNEPFWTFQLGVLLKERGEPSAAVGPLERSVELTQGTNTAALTELIDALVDLNRPRDAVTVFERIDPKIVTPTVRSTAAAAYIKAEQRETALTQLSEALFDAATRRPGDVAAVVDAITAQLTQPEAEKVVREAVSRTSGDASLRAKCILARYLLSTQDDAKLQEAQQLVASVRSDAPPGSFPQIDALLTHALCAERAGDIAGAAAAYEEVLRIDGNNIAAMNNLAYVKIDSMNAAAEAVPYAERAAELAPTNGNILDTLGWAYLRTGEMARAESTLLEASRLEPENPTILAHVGELYQKTGRSADARKAYTRLLEVARRDRNDEYIRIAEEALKSNP